MAIGPLPPVISEIQANSGQPGKTLAQQSAASSLIDLQAAATTEPTTAILPETTLIEKAVAEALGHQGGLAQLYATLTELAGASDLPDAVKSAVETIMAFRLGDGDVTPARVAEAIRSSGVFHEAVAAGKMAASPPPAVRQALAGATGDGRLATAPPAISASVPATSTTASMPVSSAAPSPSTDVSPRPNLGTSASAAQAYGRQRAMPAPTATTITSQVSSVVSAVGALTLSSAPNEAVVTVPAAGTVAPLATASVTSKTAAVPLSSNAVAAAPTTVAGEAPPSVAATTLASTAPLLSVAGNAPEGAASIPAQIVSTGDGEAVAVPSASGGAVPSSPSTSPGSPAMAAVAGRLADHPAAVFEGLAQPAVSHPARASEPSGSGAPTQIAPTVPSAPAAGTLTSSRSFAPWTPGRPLTPTISAIVTEAPTGTSTAADHPASPSVAVAAGSEAVVPRPAGERALFVPSAVENLPNSPPGSAAQRVPTGPAVTVSPATPVAASDALAQQGVTPSSGVQASSAPPQPGTGAAQEVAQSAPQVAPQPRPVAPIGVEISGAPAPQVPLRTSPPTAAPSLTAGVDLKGALEMLRRELTVWLGRNADVMASLEGTGDDAAPSRADRPAPPRKSGPVRGQPAVPLLNDEESEAVSTETMAGRALGETERSLSRVFLHQAASAESREAKVAQPTPVLMLEIPIVGPNGTSIAQLRIERDDHAPNEPGAPPRRVFQVDIAFDIAPLGSVAVRVGLMDGRRVAVGVWCESDDGLVRMEAERENIVLGLEQEGMVVAGVDLHRGHPSEGHDEMAIAPSHRLDLQL
ncbi:hypothetical protein [Pleomorphomonas sp. PLEO]|uniref:hypothetical protein n=1 Tax=Pleomorphomonas sp. PLEO TaxID=3239306 RepID=UPI00351F4FA1